MHLKRYRGKSYAILMIRLVIALLFFSLSRLLFFLFNQQYFSDLGGDLLTIMLTGIRFDITAVIVLNAPYILMNIIPFPFRQRKGWQSVANVSYYIFNTLGLALNMIDAVYFRFTAKRMTADIFSFLETGKEDYLTLAPRFLSDYFLEFFGWIVMSAVFIWIASRFMARRHTTTRKWRFYILNTLYFLIAAYISVIGIRGGFQLRPITIIDAGTYTSAKNVPLVLNTPFTIIKSFGHTGLKALIYYNDENQLNEIYDPEYYPSKQDLVRTKPYNVILIIMESFATEFIGSMNGKPVSESFTPHLDTIINNSRVYYAYANRKQSIEALPAIVASLPSLITKPYITSAYGGNNINSLASLLGNVGYNSAFYHGGRNGTMGFESFTDIAGYDQYYGKNEYDNDKDFDGNWGIYDEPFFDYFKTKLDAAEQPFFATFFSLSSHHPFVVPEKYKDKFQEGSLDIHKSIMYADYALGKFFRHAAKSPWYDSTLFVITSDHTSQSDNPDYLTREGKYSVPLIFYMPSVIEPAPKPDIAQHTDIMPSVLNFLHYPEPYVAFGNNLFDSTAGRFSISYINDTYQLIRDDWIFRSSGDHPIDLARIGNYSGKQAVTEKNPEVEKQMDAFLKAFIQQYNMRLINNNLVIRKDHE